MELSKKTKEYWEEKDWQDLENSKSIKDLYDIALRIMNRMPKPFSQVCGPIGTGGLGSSEANLNFFNETIKNLQDKGLVIFDQMPFEPAMHRIKKDTLEKGEYPNDILNDFYSPLFKLGLIKKFYFIRGWESSFGANWEHKLIKELNIDIEYL